jgi:hypothetical protein
LEPTANRAGLEPALVGLAAGDLGQTGDAVALQAAVQAGAGQMRDCGLQGLQAVIEGQQGVAAKRHHGGLFLAREHRGMRGSRSGRLVGNRRPALPLGTVFGLIPFASVVVALAIEYLAHR